MVPAFVVGRVLGLTLCPLSSLPVPLTRAAGLVSSGQDLLASTSVMQQSIRAGQVLKGRPVHPRPLLTFRMSKLSPERMALSSVRGLSSGRAGLKPRGFMAHRSEFTQQHLPYPSVPVMGRSLACSLPFPEPCQGKEAGDRPCLGSPESS